LFIPEDLKKLEELNIIFKLKEEFSFLEKDVKKISSNIKYIFVNLFKNNKKMNINALGEAFIENNLNPKIIEEIKNTKINFSSRKFIRENKEIKNQKNVDFFDTILADLI
jgi:lysophospholipase L1-like esterase